MADIRIKDITTTASASLTGDFLPIDGSTGTRKLNAFSPTFGGNATVTGTLTVNGAANGIVANGAGISLNTDYSASVRFFDGATVKWWIYKLSSDENLYFRDMGNGRMQLQMLPGATSSTAISTFNSRLEVTSTTASTTTSSGALVVGNGTSGGLGVGGSANIQGNLTLGYASAGDSVLKVIRSSGGNEWLQIAGWSAGSLGNNAYSIDAVNGASARPVYFRRSTDAGSTYSTFLTWDTSNNATFGGSVTVSVGNGVAATLGLNQTGVANAYLTQKATSGDLALGNGGGDQLTIAKITGAVSITSSSISTSTSSGALVVSGGVGVGGAIFAGGDLTVDKTEPTITFKRAANTNLNIVNFWTGAAADFGIGLRNTTDSDLHIYNYGTSNDALKIAKADSLATFGAAIRTSAPSGGTAANWKLGTVATVSPTSPNRTIEVDIGGTIYYLAAKTTNN